MFFILELQTSGLSTITGFADFDAPVEQPGGVVPKNQGLEQLKQRLPWNQPPTPPTSQSVHVIRMFNPSYSFIFYIIYYFILILRPFHLINIYTIFFNFIV